MKRLEGFRSVQRLKVEGNTLVFFGPFSSWKVFMSCPVFGVDESGGQARWHYRWRQQHPGIFECLEGNS